MIAALLFLSAQLAFAAPSGRAPAIVGPVTYAGERAQWFDLEAGQKVATTQNIRLGADILFPSGTRLLLEDKEPLSIPYAPMTFYTLHAEECEHPEWESVVEMVVPEGNAESSAAGVELTKGCNWGIYLEDKDAFTESFFSLVP